MPAFLDTNILIHHLTREDEAKAGACRRLLAALEQRDVELMTSDLVIAEVVWFLQSRTGVRRERIRELVLPLVSLRGLRLPNKEFWSRTFEPYCDKRIDFIDAYNAAWMERNRTSEVYSYDKDFDRVEGIRRIEP